MSAVALSARSVGCRLAGRQILQAVDLEVEFGTVVALVGPNGAGKSTLLGVLAGDLKRSDGELGLDGRPLEAWTARQLARRRSVLLQANRVSFPFTVREVVAMGRSPWAGTAEADGDETAVAGALAAADVEHLVDRRFTELSGGEQARVSLARVLAQQTPVVLLDEPTAALDLRHQEDVMALARGVARQGRAVVVVLHDLTLAAAWADRIVFVHEGRLAASGSPAEVLTRDRVAQVYGIDVHVLTDTPDGHPIVVPLRPASADGPHHPPLTDPHHQPPQTDPTRGDLA